MNDTIMQSDQANKQVCSGSPKNASVFVATVLAIILGGLLRIIYCIVFPVPVRDSFTYKNIILEWIETDKLSHDDFFPPLGLFLLKIPSTLFRIDIIKGGIIINVLIGLMIIATIIKTCQLFNLSQTMTLVLGLLFASHPSLVTYSCQMTRENSYLLFLALFVYHAAKYFKTRDAGQICYLSAFSCAALLCRYEALELVPLISIAIVIVEKDNIKKLMKRVSLFYVLYVLSFMLISQLIGVKYDYFIFYVKKLLKFVSQVS